MQRSLKELEMDPREVAIVGDAPIDIQAGKALAMRTIAVRTGNFRFLGHHLEALAPDHVVASVAELSASEHLTDLAIGVWSTASLPTGFSEAT
ncbi:HAD family hydrolase [Rhizobium beringeri]